MYAQLQAVARTYGGVKANNLALGGEPGSAVLNKHSESQMNSLLELGPDGWGKYQTAQPVAVDTIDRYLVRENIASVDLMKMDTQGYELHVLKGATAALARGVVKVIQVELVFTDMYARMAKPHEVLRFMDDHNMRFVTLYKIHRTRSGAAEYADALFARADAL